MPKNLLQNFILIFCFFSCIFSAQEKTEYEQEISLIESLVMGRCTLLSENISYTHYHETTIAYSVERKIMVDQLEQIKNRAPSCQTESLESTTFTAQLITLKNGKAYDSFIKEIPARLIFCIQALRLDQFLADHQLSDDQKIFQNSLFNRKKLYKLLQLGDAFAFNLASKKDFAFASLKDYFITAAQKLE